MLGAAFTGALKTRRKRKKRQPLGDRYGRYDRYKRGSRNPKEVSIGRVQRDPRRTPGKPSRPVRVQKDPRRTPGKPRPTKPVIDKSPEARQKFLSSLTKEELEKRVRRDPRRTPGKPRPVRVQKDPRRTPGKPRVQEPSKRVKEPVKGALPSKRVKEPSKIERVSKERPSKVQPRVRKRRKSKGPSYTSTSLNV